MATTVMQQAQHCNEAFVPISPSTHGWAFPGPSSRYHTRERAKTHVRTNSSASISVAPTLHTEQRAHRRAQSSYATPTLSDHDRSRAAQRFFNVHSRRSHPRSPNENRISLSRFSSFGPSHYTNMSECSSVTTPTKSPCLSRKHSMLQDSPYSDYFTDDGRSVDGRLPSLPEAEIQQLLVRLNKLQSKLMHGENDAEALSMVDRRMQEIEKDMDALHSPSQQPPELDDSGLFLQEDDECDSAQASSADAEESAEDTASSKVDSLVDRDQLLSQLQDVLDPIKAVNRSMLERLMEVRELNDQHAKQVEVKEGQIGEMQTRLDNMSADRELARAEVLRCKLDITTLAKQAQGLRGPSALGLVQRLREMLKDCHQTLQDIDARHGLLRFDSGTEPFDIFQQARWKLESHVDEEGTLQTISITRVRASDSSQPLESSVLAYIDAVEDIVRDEQATSRYVDASVQTAQQVVCDANTQSEPREMRDASIQTGPQTIYDWRNIGSSNYSSDDLSLDEELDTSERVRPVFEWPDDLDNCSCAVTTTPASEVDATELDSRLSRLMKAVSSFVDGEPEIIEDQCDSEAEAAIATPAVRGAEAVRQEDSGIFWAELMEIAGFVDH